jgi:hypothetical protein
MPHDKGEVFSAAIHNLMLVHEIICNGRFVPLKELAKRARSSHTSDAKSAGLQGLAKILSEIIQALHVNIRLHIDGVWFDEHMYLYFCIRLDWTPWLDLRGLPSTTLLDYQALQIIIFLKPQRGPTK